MPADFENTFEKLRAILKPLEGRLVVVADKPGSYYLNTRKDAPNGHAMFFGAVRIGKRYVSYHLIPVYVCPRLLEGMSAGLKKRMQGKSCFNFKSIEAAQLKELATLTKRGLAEMKKLGWA